MGALSTEITLGFLAIGIGVLTGLVLFIPFVAVSYRRHGRMTFGRSLLWASALVYFWAIWTYTLLPLPTPGEYRCAGVNLNLFAFMDDVSGAFHRGHPLSDPAMLQLLLNVVLFVPLGFFVRVLGGRGVIVAILAGAGVSLLIETTQLTGNWGLYACAYRVFDVDDLLTNTVGAALGAIAAFVVPAARRTRPGRADQPQPQPVRRGRRFLAVTCDLMAATVVYISAVVFAQLALDLIGDTPLEDTQMLSQTLGALVTAGIWLLMVMLTGRSLGDSATLAQFTGGPLPVWLARLLRWAGGIGGYLVLTQLPAPWGLSTIVFVVAHIVLFFTTAGGRGLPGIISGQRLADSRAIRDVGEEGPTDGAKASQSGKTESDSGH